MKEFIPNRLTSCCHTRSWSIIQGKETKKNISGYKRREVIKKHAICINKRCLNYLKPTTFINSEFFELSKVDAHTHTHTHTPHTIIENTQERERERERTIAGELTKD